MEELKILVEMVASLPQMAIWVLVAFWFYKVVVIGSIFGVIRLAIIKIHDWLTRPKVVNHKLGERLAIDEETLLALHAQISRIASTNYIHMGDVNKLREAIDLIKKP